MLDYRNIKSKRQQRGTTGTSHRTEMWFGIFDRKLLKRGNFKSKQDIKEQIEKFIFYYNETMAKPFKWTFKGQPLKN